MTVSATFKHKDAASYDQVAGTFDGLTHRYATAQAQALVRAIDIGARRHVIDLGCGTGLVAFHAAAASGQDTQITGIDLSAGMLAQASFQARQADLSDRVRFQTGDAEALDLPDGCVDGIVSLYAFSHFPHPQKAAQEALRVLSPGGHLAVAIGSGPRLMTVKGMKRAAVVVRRKQNQAQGREVTANEQIDRLVRQHLPPVEEGHVATWASGQRDITALLDELFGKAGFVDRTRDWIGTDYAIPAIDEYWTLQSTLSTFARKHIAAANAQQNAMLKDAFWAECEGVMARKGKLAYSVGAAIVSARKPE